jgi:hypothetical protein
MTDEEEQIPRLRLVMTNQNEPEDTGKKKEQDPPAPLVMTNQDERDDESEEREATSEGATLGSDYSCL